MRDVMFRADCSSCVALCCTMLAFDRSELFAFDKEAGVACSHLTASTHSCSIHSDLAGGGFAGCARYDCLGAGQRVTQEIFGGRSWRDHPSLAASMFDAFRVMRDVHELLVLLRTAEELRLPEPQLQKRRELLDALQPAGGWSSSSLRAFERSGLQVEVRSFLSSLREHLTRDGRRRLPVLP